MVNLYYNYYCVEGRPQRQQEIDYCLMNLLSNNNIDNVYIIVSDKDSDTLKNLVGVDGNIIIHNSRPTFHYMMYDVCDKYTSDTDINIFMNSDCFFGDETDWDFIKNMDGKTRFSVSRYNLSSVDPITIIKDHFPHATSQDCWIFKGHATEMDLDFHFGIPFCDYRISYELGVGGYDVKNMVSKIKILHYHVCGYRGYKVTDGIAGNYANIELS